MLKIGQTLKERREELGYSIQAMATKTRVPAQNLNAIEEGNLKYFENDITYVKFYIRYYCNALHLNYEDYKEELEKALEEFSNTTKMMKMVELEELHTRISDRSKKSGSKKVITRKAKRNQKFDLSFWSFVSVVSILIIALTFVFGFLILPKLLNKTPETVVEIPELPSPIQPEETTEEPNTEVETKVLSIAQINAENYEVTGYLDQQELQMLIQFKSNAYVSILVDGVSTFNPASKLYSVGSTLDLKFNAKSNMVIEVYIGWMNGNTLTLNGLEVPLDTTIATRNGSVTLVFTFKGDI